MKTELKETFNHHVNEQNIQCYPPVAVTISFVPINLYVLYTSIMPSCNSLLLNSLWVSRCCLILPYRNRIAPCHMPIYFGEYGIYIFL